MILPDYVVILSVIAAAVLFHIVMPRRRTRVLQIETPPPADDPVKQPPPMKEIIEIYRAANKQFSWRRRSKNGRLLSCPGETFTSRGGLANNLRANFNIDVTAKTLPFDHGDLPQHVTLNGLPVEIRTQPAPRRPRTHKEHTRKATAATLK